MKCIPKSTESCCCKPVELQGRQPVIINPPHISWNPNVSLHKGLFSLEEYKKRVSGVAVIPGHNKRHKLYWSMNALHVHSRNHTNWIDLWKLSKSAWENTRIVGIDTSKIAVHEMKS
jgi:hypothetical protein